MNYLGMNEKEFLAYLLKMVDISIEAQKKEKEWLKRHGGGTNYDQ